MNTCSKPGCTRAGAAILGYDYAERLALLEDPPETGPLSPHLYTLCVPCAERLRPPQGWVLNDVRTKPPLFVTDGRATVSTISTEEVEDEEPVTHRRQLFFGYSA